MFTIVATIQISTSCSLFNNQLKAQRCTWQWWCICWRPLPHTHGSQPTQLLRGVAPDQRSGSKYTSGTGRSSYQLGELVAAKFYFSPHQSKPLSPIKYSPRTFPSLQTFLPNDSSPYTNHKSTFQLSKWVAGSELWSRTSPSPPSSPPFLGISILLEKKIHQCLLIFLVKHGTTRKATHHGMTRLCLLGCRRVTCK